MIQEQCRSIEENLKKEKSASNYKPKNFDVSRPGVGVSVEHVQVRGKGKHRKVVQQVSQYEKQTVSNYDLLQKLGFD